MRYDLGPDIARALKAKDEWSEARLLDCVASVRLRIPRVMVDWDSEAGEGWVRIMQEDEVVVMVRADCPLIFVHTRVQEMLQDEPVLGTLVVHLFDNLVDRRYSADPSLLAAMNGGPIGPGFSANAFSIHDLWCATV